MTIEWILVGGLVGWALGQAVSLAWDMWRYPRSRWAEDARADIEAAKARELERRANR